MRVISAARDVHGTMFFPIAEWVYGYQSGCFVPVRVSCLGIGEILRAEIACIYPASLGSIIRRSMIG